jgi:hypothetical protein
MVEWSEDHVVAVCYFNTQYFDLIDGTWLNWRSCGTLRWQVETASWECWGVVCGKLVPPRL